DESCQIQLIQLRLAYLESRTKNLEAQSQQLQSQNQALQSKITTLQSQNQAAQAQITQLNNKTQYMNVSTVDNGPGVVFEGANVYIRNGQGSTETNNGLGNLIVGYNENQHSKTRTGSHNLVIGTDNDYTSYGGMSAGKQNASSAPYALALGGTMNSAQAAYSATLSGMQNQAGGIL